VGSEAPADEGEAPLLKAFEAAADEQRASGAAILEAFAAVCRKQLRLEPEVVLRSHLGPYVDRLRLDEFDRAKPDKAAVRRWRELYEAHWNRRQAA
jgi:hypothetical protein